MNFLRSRLTAFFACFAGVLTAVACVDCPGIWMPGFASDTRLKSLVLHLRTKSQGVSSRSGAPPFKILLVHLGFLVAWW